MTHAMSGFYSDSSWIEFSRFLARCLSISLFSAALLRLYLLLVGQHSLGPDLQFAVCSLTGLGSECFGLAKAVCFSFYLVSDPFSTSVNWALLFKTVLAFLLNSKRYGLQQEDAILEIGALLLSYATWASRSSRAIVRRLSTTRCSRGLQSFETGHQSFETVSGFFSWVKFLQSERERAPDGKVELCTVFTSL